MGKKRERERGGGRKGKKLSIKQRKAALSTNHTSRSASLKIRAVILRGCGWIRIKSAELGESEKIASLPCTSTRPRRPGLHLWLLDIQSLPEQIPRLHASRWLASSCASLCYMMRHWFGFGVFDIFSAHGIGCGRGSVTAHNEYLIKCFPFTNFSSSAPHIIWILNH